MHTIAKRIREKHSATQLPSMYTDDAALLLAVGQQSLSFRKTFLQLAYSKGSGSETPFHHSRGSYFDETGTGKVDVEAQLMEGK